MINRGELNERLDAIYYRVIREGLLADKTKYPVEKLGNVAFLNRGRFAYRPRNDPSFYGGSYPFIQTGDVVVASEEHGDIPYTQTLNEKGLEVSKLFHPERILITIAANIGDTAILRYSACFPDSVVSIVPKDSRLSLDYLNYYFKFVKNYLVALAPQSAQKNINLQQLSPTPIVIPPKEVQAEIVAKMDAVYAGKKRKEAEAQRLLDSIDAYLLGELGIELPEVEESTVESRTFIRPLSEISNNRFDAYYYKAIFEDSQNALTKGKYPVRKLRDIAKDIKNGVEMRTYSEEGFRYLRVTDLGKYSINNTSPRYVNAEAIPSKIRLNENCILVSRSGSLGLISIVNAEIMNSILSSHIFKVELDTFTILPSYAEAFLRSKLGQVEIFRENNGGVIPEINQTALKAILLPIPPIGKQKEIVNQITAIHTQAKQLQQQAVTELAQAKQEVEQLILGE